eukprot:235749-Rhodomonas_salina.1
MTSKGPSFLPPGFEPMRDGEGGEEEEEEEEEEEGERPLQATAGTGLSLSSLSLSSLSLWLSAPLPLSLSPSLLPSLSLSPATLVFPPSFLPPSLSPSSPSLLLPTSLSPSLVPSFPPSHHLSPTPSLDLDPSSLSRCSHRSADPPVAERGGRERRREERVAVQYKPIQVSHLQPEIKHKEPHSWYNLY